MRFVENAYNYTDTHVDNRSRWFYQSTMEKKERKNTTLTPKSKTTNVWIRRSQCDTQKAGGEKNRNS